MENGRKVWKAVSRPDSATPFPPAARSLSKKPARKSVSQAARSDNSPLCRANAALL